MGIEPTDKGFADLLSERCKRCFLIYIAGSHVGPTRSGPETGCRKQVRARKQNHPANSPYLEVFQCLSVRGFFKRLALFAID